MRAFLFFIFMVLLLPFAALSDTGWNLKKSINGIDVYIQTVPGSNFKAFKAVALIESRSNEIVKILKDVNAYPKWFAYTEKAELLNDDVHERHVYMETGLPWPFSNEDMVYKMVFTDGESSGISINLTGVPGYIPPVNGISRMKGASGFIILKNMGKHTEVTYSMHSELGGSIPPWIANQNIHEMPLRTLGNLKKILNGEAT